MSLAFSPRYCVWELTLACNLRCDHCGSRAGRPRADELTTAECLAVVEDLAALGCRLITLSGGEPTLRSDWETIARAAQERGIIVNMVTNGTTMTEALARRIAASGLANVAVSLDGPEALHDSVRGPGTFRRSTRGLDRLADAGVPTAVITHLDQRSAACLEEIHDVAVAHRARLFRLQLGKPMGNLCEHRDRLLEPRDLLAVVPRIANLKRRSPIWVDVGDSLGYYGPDEATLRRKGWSGMQSSWTGCQAGRYAIGIESDGGVKGCLSLQATLAGRDGDPFREGSVRERRLLEIWRDPEVFAWNRQPRPEALTGFCRRCRHAAVCRGGAKCVSAAFTGAISEDPYCYHRVRTLEERRAGVGGFVRRQAAAAMLGLGLGAGLSGCPSRDGDVDPPDAAAVAPDADPCVDPCPNCDYGVWPPVCGPDAGAVTPDAAPPPSPDAAVDPCAEVCCECEYGIPPPPECCPPPPPPPGPDAGDPCADVCCDCDYGVPPPPECCQP